MIDFDTLKEGIIKYLTTKTGKSPANYNLPYSYLSAMFTWMVDVAEIIPLNPIKVLKLKKMKDDGRARDINEDVVKKIISSIVIHYFAGFRDYCTIMISLDTGIRPGELFQLRVVQRR